MSDRCLQKAEQMSPDPALCFINPHCPCADPRQSTAEPQPPRAARTGFQFTSHLLRLASRRGQEGDIRYMNGEVENTTFREFEMQLNEASQGDSTSWNLPCVTCTVETTFCGSCCLLHAGRGLKRPETRNSNCWLPPQRQDQHKQSRGVAGFWSLKAA